MPGTVSFPRHGGVWRFPVAALLLTLLALLGSLLLTGAVFPPDLLDPGPLVRWGLPMVTSLMRIAATITIGAFVLCALVLPRPAGHQPGHDAPSGASTSRSAWELAALVGTGAALVWAPAHLAHLLLTHSGAINAPIGGVGYGLQLFQFVTEVDLGRGLAWATLLAALVALFSAGVASRAAAGWTALLALATLFPTATTGHAAGAANHDLAVSSWWLHLIGVSVWVGGLTLLCLVAARLGTGLPQVVRRYSILAGWCFALAALAGVLNAWVRLTTPLDLLQHPYGQLLLAKVVLTAALGLAGWAHRRRTIPAIDAHINDNPGPGHAGAGLAFWRLAGVEVLLMGAVVGIGVALGSSAPPAPEEAPPGSGTVFVLTGYLEPPAPHALSYLTQWTLEPISLTVVLAALIVYLRGALRLYRRGQRWPMWRTAAWVAGLLLVVWATNGGAAVYGRVLFSGLALQFTTIALVAPVLLVLAAPLTLTRRAFPGGRAALARLGRTRWVALASHPGVAVVLYALSWAVLCFSPLLYQVTTVQMWRTAMLAWFAVMGCLVASAILGGPPSRRRSVRLTATVLVLVCHMLLGIALLTSNSLLAAEFFGQLGLSWGVDALADQASGGVIIWASAAVTTLLLGLAVVKHGDDRADHDHPGLASNEGS